MAMGVIQGMASLGAIICAGVVPLLLKLPGGWRRVYGVGVVPLLLLALPRRSLGESQRFRAPIVKRSLLAIWRTPRRRRVLQIAVIWGLAYTCTHNAITWWKEFALGSRGLSDAEVGAMTTIAALTSAPLVLVAGKLLDLIGRRRGAVVICSL